MPLEEQIRRQAAALGFSACGFTRVAPLDRGAFFEGWLDAGFAGEMHYLARHPERRLGVGGILADARTVISLTSPYRPPPPPPIDWRTTLRGRIAAYALGNDYHDVIEQRLTTLSSWIDTHCPGSRTRRYVDTGAVLEREWAMRAGLGWFGKNTMLLSTQAGSWFFLAELITTAACEPDAPTPAHCGHCRACLDDCPTGALRDGLVMDAPRCIAYLTIEHRSAIPHAMRPALGAWIFGCDVCQSVCPWNGNPPAAATDGGASETWLYPSLPDVLGLDAAAFRRHYGRTPVARAKRRGLLRNVAVALGNSGNPAAVAPLAAALANDPEALVRGHAAWALGALEHTAARRALDDRWRRETDPTVVDEIAAALAR